MYIEEFKCSVCNPRPPRVCETMLGLVASFPGSCAEAEPGNEHMYTTQQWPE